jgi:hypothetical protein
MADLTDRRTETDEQSRDATKEWQAPTLTALGDAVPLTLGASGSTPDGPGLQS